MAAEWADRRELAGGKVGGWPRSSKRLKLLWLPRNCVAFLELTQEVGDGVIRFSEQELLSAVRHAYMHGDATFELQAARSALLVIDMQDEFVRPGWTPFWVPEATRQVPRVRRLIEFCRAQDIPVIYTAFARTHQLLDRPRSGTFMPNRLAGMGPSDPAWFQEGRIWHELEPRPDDVVIHKPSCGAFTTRRSRLSCATCDVCATDDPAMQDPELKVLRKGFARVLTSEEIVASGTSRRPGNDSDRRHVLPGYRSAAESGKRPAYIAIHSAAASCGDRARPSRRISLR